MEDKKLLINQTASFAMLANRYYKSTTYYSIQKRLWKIISYQIKDDFDSKIKRAQKYNKKR